MAGMATVTSDTKQKWKLVAASDNDGGGEGGGEGEEWHEVGRRGRRPKSSRGKKVVQGGKANGKGTTKRDKSGDTAKGDLKSDVTRNSSAGHTVHVSQGVNTVSNVSLAASQVSDSSSNMQSKSKFRNRYQDYLVDQLRRVIDELYLLFELDYDFEGAQRAQDLLRESFLDFDSLIQRNRLPANLDLDDINGESSRSPIAWEVRKTRASPKHMLVLEELTKKDDLELSFRELPADLDSFRDEYENMDGTFTPLGKPHELRLDDLDREEDHDPSSPDICAGLPSKGLKRSSSTDEESVQRKLTALDNASSIQAKLMSPERNRKKTPLETKQLAEMKQARAEATREEQKEALAARLARLADDRQAKQSQVAERREKMGQDLESRYRRSQELREAHIQTIQKKASEQNLKVSEVQITSQLAQEVKKKSLEQKLEESRARRDSHIDSIRKKQRDTEIAAEEAEVRRRAQQARRQQQQEQAQQKRRDLRSQRAEAQRVLDEAYNENQRAARETREKRSGTPEAVTAVRERLKHAAARRLEYMEQIRNTACLENRPRSPRQSDAESPTRRTSDTREAISYRRVVASSPKSAKCSVGGINDKNSIIADSTVKVKSWKTRAKKLRKRLSQSAFTPQETELSEIVESVLERPCWRLRQSLIHVKRRLESEKLDEKTGKSVFQVRRAELLMAEAKKVLDGGTEAEKHAVRRTGFLSSLVSALGELPITATMLASSLAKLIAQLLKLTVNCESILCTNGASSMVPALCMRLCGFDESTGDPVIQPPTPDDPESVALEGLLLIFSEILGTPMRTEKARAMREDLVKYLVSVGVIHRIRDFVVFYERDLEPTPVPGCVDACLSLLTAMARRPTVERIPVYSQPTATHSQDLVLSALKDTVLAGHVSLLTGVVLLAGPARGSIGGSRTLPPNFAEVSLNLMRFLTVVGRLNLGMLQDMMGSSDMRVEAYHLVSFLLSYCSREWKQSPRRGVVEGLLNEVLIFIGYFSLLRSSNQDVLHWGSSPTILQKLCDLPFAYYCKADLMKILMPTLLIACFKHEQNRAVLSEQLSMEFLTNHIDKMMSVSLQAQDCEGDLYSLSERFPVDRLEEAKQFFTYPR